MTTQQPTAPAVPAEQLPDVRRLIGFRAHGAARVVLEGHAALEDVEGSLHAGQAETAVLMAHELVHISLSVRSLATRGELSWPQGQVTFDPFAGLPAQEAADGERLAAAGTGLTGEAAEDWLRQLRDHLAESERRLGYPERLPYIRAGSGMFKAIGLVRTWSDHLEQLGLPGVLPGDWALPGD